MRLTEAAILQVSTKNCCRLLPFLCFLPSLFYLRQSEAVQKDPRPYYLKKLCFDKD